MATNAADTNSECTTDKIEADTVSYLLLGPNGKF